VFGLESIKDADGNVIQEAPLRVWANFQQRALDVAILEINAKTDLKIKLASTERSKHRRVVALNFTIKAQAIPNGDPKRKNSKRVWKQRSKVPAHHHTSVGIDARIATENLYSTVGQPAIFQ